MANQFTAVIERDGEWFIAHAPEIPGAHGQGKTKEADRQHQWPSSGQSMERPPFLR
jgi:hypothetical protein